MYDKTDFRAKINKRIISNVFECIAHHWPKVRVGSAVSVVAVLDIAVALADCSLALA